MNVVSTLYVYFFRIAFALVFVGRVAAAAEAATASWDPNAEPDVAGYKLSYGTQPGVHTVTIDVGKVTTYQFNPPGGQRYYVVVQAYNTGGEVSAKSAEVFIDIPLSSPSPAPPPVTAPAPVPTTASATFAGSDTVTRGTWRGVYGADGHMLAPSVNSLPSYAQVAVGAVTHTWDPNSTDPRVLQLPTGSARVAATWYASDAFAFNIKITDGKAHAVSLYALDWDRLGRAESIEVLDAATLAVLDKRNAAVITDGVYLTWQISGSVIIRITRLAGPNAVVGGLFFGPSSATSSDGTVVPPSAQIVDATGAVWTLAGDFRVLRNGIHAAGGYGSKLLWSGGAVYTLGLDGIWWKWTASSWVYIGTVQPGGSITPPASPTPPPPPPTAAPSADGTAVPPAAQIIDSTGAVWTLAADRRVLRNGVLAASGYGTKLLWSGGMLYTFGLDSNWWRWTGSGWIISTTPPPAGTSANGTVVPPASQIVDSSGAVWTIDSSKRILRNGVQAAGGIGSKILWSGGNIYVLGDDGYLWWKWTGGGWSNVGGVLPAL